MKCLTCHQEMVEKLEQTRRGPVYYDVCEACGGMWFDFGELDAMVFQLYQSVEASSRDKADNVSEPVRQCPRCENQPLLKVFFLRFSNILLDYCENCYGFWLDRGELRRINKELADLKKQGGGDTRGLLPPGSPGFFDLFLGFFDHR